MTDDRVSQANLFEVGERSGEKCQFQYQTNVTAILDENRKEEIHIYSIINNYYLYNTHTVVVIMATE